MPFYNDLENFKVFVNELTKLNLTEPYFLLLDNGSDKSIVEEDVSFSSRQNTSWELLRSEENLAFGGGVLYAACHVEEDFICWMPGNMKVKPGEVLDLITKEVLIKNNVLVKAKRIKRPLSDSLKTKVFGLVASIYFKKYMYDIGGTPNIINKKTLLQISNPPTDFSFDAFIYYFAKLNNLYIKRPKISYTKRLHGKSHWQKGIVSELQLTKNILTSKKEWKKIALENTEKKNDS